MSGKNNKPVAGLKREDFELYDNNKPQPITSFSYEETDKRRVGDQTTEANSLPRAIAAGELKRVIAFVVDTLHIKFEDIYRTRKMLEDFVDNKMQPGDLVLILPTGGGSGVLQQFTSDRRILHRAIDRLRPFFFSNDTTPYRSFPRLGAGNLRAMPDPLEEADVRATLSALNETIKSMARLPGRKVSVFVSEGLRIFATRTTNDVDKTTSLAARANVVFYTIDPRGLDPLVLGAGDELDPEADAATAVASASDQKRDDFHESQSSLRAIAADSGGKFFGNNNDIKQGLDAMLDENAAYSGEGGTPSQRRFSRNGEFTYSLAIYNPKLDGRTREPQLEMRARILKGSQVVFKGEPRPVLAMQGSTPTRIITGRIVTLLKLPPDDYTLEVTVRDKLRGKESRSVIRQEMDFSVE